MKRLKGPALKLPDWLKGSSGLKTPDVKVPAVLSDIYWDLRDRRLLPLVAVIAVAIGAVPFVLGGDSEVEPPPGPATSTSSALENADGSSLVVVEATPGLRDYRKRLAARTPTNPFKQPHRARNLKGAQFPESPGEATSSSSVTTGSGSSDSTSGSSGGESVSPSPAPDDSSSGGSKPSDSPKGDGGAKDDGGDTAGTPELTFFTFAINVRIARSGGNDAEAKKASKQSEPVIKERVLPLTALPGEKAPVVTYMGSSKKGKALLMVSNEVKSTFGDAKCVSGDDVCQLLEAEPGFPVTFVYGYNEVHYTINVLKIYSVVTGRS